MYVGLLHLHNAARWLVLVAAVIAISVAVIGLLRRSEWGRGAKLSSLAFLIVMDTQLVIGLLLYGVSPLVRAAMGDVSFAMANTELRFFLVEHLLLMVVAVVLVHVGYALAKRSRSAGAAYRRAALFFTLALAAVLAGIPWDRPLLPGA